MASSKNLKTQTALERKSGVAQSTIGRILRREVSPQSVSLELIAEAFGMPLSKLAEMGEVRGHPAEGEE
jgi:transcriptional regulator with XRE-family HTH domain